MTNVISREQLYTAEEAMKLRAEINRLTDDLDDILGNLLIYSDGESYTIPVSGRGSVQVVAATEAGLPSGQFNYIFNKDKFLAMTEAMKRKLAREGVVELEEKLSKARKASLRVKFNA